MRFNPSRFFNPCYRSGLNIHEYNATHIGITIKYGRHELFLKLCIFHFSNLHSVILHLNNMLAPTLI
jgi:hypothetical protein